MDDFTIILPALPDMSSCDLKVYDELDRLWRMVERYKMTPLITITVLDNAARHVRAIRGCRIQASAWQLEDTITCHLRKNRFGVRACKITRYRIPDADGRNDQ